MDDILSIILNHLSISDILNYRLTNNYNNNYVCTKLLEKHIIEIKSENLDNLYLLNNCNGIKNVYYDLDLAYDDMISDKNVKRLTSLTSLYLKWNKKISDASVKCLINLTLLDLSGNEKVSNESVKCLVNLASLNLHG